MRRGRSLFVLLALALVALVAGCGPQSGPTAEELLAGSSKSQEPRSPAAIPFVVPERDVVEEVRGERFFAQEGEALQETTDRRFGIDPVLLPCLLQEPVPTSVPRCVLTEADFLFLGPTPGIFGSTCSSAALYDDGVPCAHRMLDRAVLMVRQLERALCDGALSLAEPPYLGEEPSSSWNVAYFQSDGDPSLGPLDLLLRAEAPEHDSESAAMLFTASANLHAQVSTDHAPPEDRIDVRVHLGLALRGDALERFQLDIAHGGNCSWLACKRDSAGATLSCSCDLRHSDSTLAPWSSEAAPARALIGAFEGLAKKLRAEFEKDLR